MMPGLGGLEVVRHLSKSTPDIRIIVLSMHADEAYVIEALRHGASGYVLKDADSLELVQAVRRVADGRRYLSPPLSERAIEAYIGRDEDEPFDVYNTLTAREREVLHLAAQGHTNAQIADRLCISPRTVEVHRANMMHKLALDSQTDLIRYALTKGILPMEK
jgi:DNA-binding NarL/FixJ family response regulator